MEQGTKKRILFLGVLPPTVHGQAIVTDQILSILCRHKFNVKVIRIHDLGAETSFLIKSFYLLKSLFYFLIYMFPAKQIVYLPAANSLVGTFRNIPFILFSRVMGHEIVIHFHSGDYNTLFINQWNGVKKLIKWIFSFVNTIVILGESIKSNFSEIFHPKMRIVSINNAINIKDCHFPVTKEFNHSSVIHILYMSNLIKSKGYFDLLKAIQILYHDYKIHNMKIDFCGGFLEKNSQQAKSEFLNYVKENNLESIVNLRGLVEGTLKDEIINKADFFVLPTYYETEAMPISILEAMKAGVLVISTDYRVIPELIIDDFTGCLVKPHSPQQIAFKIQYLLSNVDKYNLIRTNGFIHIKENFSEKLFSKRIISLFNSFQ